MNRSPALAITGSTGAVGGEVARLLGGYASRAEYAAPDWQVDAWVSTYTAIASDDLSRVSEDVQAVTGAPPISLREFLASRHD